MSRRKVLMQKKINQALTAGKPASAVAPKNMKRASLTKLINQFSK